MPYEEPLQASLSSTNIKRARPSDISAPTPPVRSHKKRKAQDEAEDLGKGGSSGGGRSGPMTFGVGMVKGREEEFGEVSDIQTKIDFNELPDETLYRYLELHDLLPRWTASPWSEEPCTPPNALYALAAALPSVPIVPEGETEPEYPPPTTAISAEARVEGDITKEEPNPSETPDGGDENEASNSNGDETPVAPTTRSKTAPLRKQPTPPESTPMEVKRGVITLSDMNAARAILAEKANAHWIKGLGGGQNKEGETIVQFLYKMKVGPGRLLRVYNPYPPPFAY